MVPFLVPETGRDKNVGMLLNIFKIDIGDDSVYLFVHITL